MKIIWLKDLMHIPEIYSQSSIWYWLWFDRTSPLAPIDNILNRVVDPLLDEIQPEETT